MKELREEMIKIIEEIGEGRDSERCPKSVWCDEECRACKEGVRKALREEEREDGEEVQEEKEERV